MNQGRRQFVRGSALNLVGNVTFAVCGFLLAFVVARALGPQGTGSFFIVVSFAMILVSVLKLGADTGIMRMVAWYRSRGNPASIRPTYRIAVIPVGVAALVVGSVVVVFAQPLSRILGADSDSSPMSDYLRVMAASIPLLTLHLVLAGGSRGFGSTLPANTLEKAGRPILQVLGVATVLWLTTSPTALAVAWAAPSALMLGFSVAWTRRLIRRAEACTPAHEDSPKPALGRDFWAFSLPRSGATLFDVALVRLDVILLGALAGAAEAGIYIVASRMIMLGGLLFGALAMAAAPIYSEQIARSDWANAARLYRATTALSMALSWPILLLLLTVSPPLLAIFGEQFVTGELALQILAAAMLLQAGTGTSTSLLLMSGYSRLNLYNSLAALLLNIVLNVLLIPPFGMVGAASAWAAAIAVKHCAPLAQMHSRTGLHPFDRRYAVVAALSIFCVGGAGLFSRILFGAGPASLLSAVVGGGTAYLLALALLRRRLGLDVALKVVLGRGAGRGAAR
jgi:O-antigen/teichoic acid export membrane protein